METLKKYSTPILIALLFLAVGIVFYQGYQSGKKSEKISQAKTQIDEANKKIENYQKNLVFYAQNIDSLYKLKKEKEVVYKTLKDEVVKYSAKIIEVPKKDSICLQYTTVLENKYNSVYKAWQVSDSLLTISNSIISNQEKAIALKDSIINEKSKVIDYTNILTKPKTKRFGLGVFGGYGTNFNNGFSPILGIGISYNLITF